MGSRFSANWVINGIVGKERINIIKIVELYLWQLSVNTKFACKCKNNVKMLLIFRELAKNVFVFEKDLV